jgi:dihydrolipoamide dehydrogenase
MMNVVIIGGGPGGYVAAIRASQYGGKVTLIDKDFVGGTCVNRGCIPTKALLKGLEPLIELTRHQSMGFTCTNPGIDLNKLRNHVKKSIQLSRAGIEYLLKNRQVTLLKGEAISIEDRFVIVQDTDGTNQKIDYDHLILAMGSVVSKIPGIEIDGKQIISSDEALEVADIPKKLLIIGGGVIGVEMATIYKALGSEVQIVEMMDQILPGEDKEAVAILKNSLIKLGIKINTSCKVENILQTNNTCDVCIQSTETVTNEEYDKILVCTGRKPNIQPKLLDPIKVKYSNKGVVTNEWMETNIKNVHAIGDLNGISMLAHTAFTEAKIVCARIFGKQTESIQYPLMPRCIYTIPEFAAVGNTNSAETYTFPFSANGRARASSIREGLIKVNIENNMIVGCTIIGINASDLISLATMAIQNKLSLEQLSLITFPHPTYSEVFPDVIEVAEKLPIHLV